MNERNQCYSPDLGQLCQVEEREWCTKPERRAQIIPEMVLLLLIRLDGGSSNE
jgi:hypothetical protein